mmetsp:Transcript_14948/g.24335  ORF Transcript_14948/g.24335 Transcript_14948/m.24335 type:complete len:249 (+) Transcript_14948:39-785(+)
MEERSGPCAPTPSENRDPTRDSITKQSPFLLNKIATSSSSEEILQKDAEATARLSAPKVIPIRKPSEPIVRRTTPVPASNLMSRLQGFLGKMKTANEKLLHDIEQNGRGKYEIDLQEADDDDNDDDDNDSNEDSASSGDDRAEKSQEARADVKMIEMNLGLGVFEARSREEEKANGYTEPTADEVKKRTDEVLGIEKGNESKVNHPGVELLPEPSLSKKREALTATKEDGPNKKEPQQKGRIKKQKII